MKQPVSFSERDKIQDTKVFSGFLDQNTTRVVQSHIRLVLTPTFLILLQTFDLHNVIYNHNALQGEIISCFPLRYNKKRILIRLFEVIHSAKINTVINIIELMSSLKSLKRREKEEQNREKETRK